MNKQLYTRLAGLLVAWIVATLPALAQGSALTVPFEEPFDTVTSVENYTFIDANNDGYKWIYSPTRKSLCTQSDWEDNAHDDWVITPAISLTGGKTYKLTFDLASTAAFIGYAKLAVTLGTAATAEAQTTVLLADKQSPDGSESVEVDFHIAETGTYYIGFHDITPQGGYNMTVDNLRLDIGLDPSAPAAVSGLTVTPGARGALSATLSFTAPTLNTGNTALSDITAFHIYRGDSLIATADAAAPGQAVTYTDNTVPTDSTYSYTVAAVNAAGEGVKASAKAFIGKDYPLPAKNIKVIDNGTNLTISWDPATETGARGGYVDPSEVVYTIYDILDDGSGMARDTVRGANSYVIPMQTNEGEQRYIYYGLRAQNAQGYNDIFPTPWVVIGKPSTLPFEESFKGRTQRQYWWRQSTGMYSFSTTGESADGDGGCVYYRGWAGSEESWLNTAKISLAGAKRPTLMLNYRSDAYMPMVLYVDILKANGEKDSLLIADLNDNDMEDWQTFKADLSAYASEPFIVVKFHALSQDSYTEVYLDNISITDLPQTDLALTINSVDDHISRGESKQLVLRVTNKGADDISLAHLAVAADDDIIYDQDITTTIPSYGWRNIKVPYTANILGEDSTLALSAVVTTDGDENDANNSVVASLDIFDSQATPVDNLQGSMQDTKVSLSWEMPDEVQTESTYDFESDEPWSYSFGSWKTIDGDNGVAPMLWSGYTYPSMGDQFAYTVFNPADVYEGMEYDDNYAAHSGSQYAVATQSVNAGDGSLADQDNWLISPALSGKAQTIRFYAANTLRPSGTSTPERFEVLTSTTDNSQSSFSAVGETRSVDGGKWTLFEVEVPDSTRYFAIHHVSTADEAYIFRLDDFTYLTSGGTVSKFNIYQDGTLLKQSSTPYATLDSDGQAHTYSVTALYANGCESAPRSVTVATTGISTVKQIAVKNGFIYNVKGQLVRRDGNTHGLPAGIYIINGKKIVLK